MIKLIKIFEDLPLEVGKTYRTKFQSGENFTVTKDPFKRDKDGNIIGKCATIYGIYERYPHLGECPLSAERIIHDRIDTGRTIEVCNNCGELLTK